MSGPTDTHERPLTAVREAAPRNDELPPTERCFPAAAGGRLQGWDDCRARRRKLPSSPRGKITRMGCSARPVGAGALPLDGHELSWAHGSSGAPVLMAAPTIAGSPSQGLAPSRSRLPLVHGMCPVMFGRRMDALDRSARSRARRTTFKGVVAVLTPVCRLGCGDRQGPEDAGVAIRQRAVLQVGAVRVGKADQQVVAVRPGQPRFSDGKAVLDRKSVV